ncbi:MAG: hypothetical protein MJA32_13160 [Proteobacteria bacterium]|nr:hypothetical protein [Pseudomonadota bacterium]
MASPLVEKSHGAFREWFRKVWRVRGGGLYACGFAAMLVYLEVGSLAEDLSGVGAVFSGGAIGAAAGLFIDFLIDSFTNTIAALMWPIAVVRWAPPWGAVALGLAYWLFPIYLKKPIENWMFGGRPPVDADTEDAAGNEKA